MFCKHCGTQLQAGAGFCSNCGAAQRRKDSVHPPAPDVPVSGRPPAACRPTAPRKPLKDRIMDSLVIPVAIILILIGIGYIFLAFVGKTTTAQVTGYEQVMFINNDESTRNPSRYKLEYQFSVGGERYTGSVTRVFSGGSHMRQTLPVRYLPFWPHVSAEDGEPAGFAGSVMAGAGVVVLVFGVKKKSRLRNKNR